MLGIVKFTTDGCVDLSHAEKLMNRYAHSRDPFERAAAIAAKNLTRKEFHPLGASY